MTSTPERPRRRRMNPGLVGGISIMGIVVLIAVLAPIFLSHAAEQLTDVGASGPSTEHWLGTDSSGRDLLARSLVATRITLLMTACATAIAVCGGILLGTMIWVAPRRMREIGLRTIDSLVAFPSLLFALVIAAILGAGAASSVAAIGLAGVPYFARLTANLSGSIARRDFVGTARRLGVPSHRIISAHLLPNMAEPLLVLTASSFAQSLTAISGLSFVGLGVQSPDFDYGKLLNTALPSLLAGRAYEVVGPAVLIVVVGVAATLVGDGLAAIAKPPRVHAVKRRGRRTSSTSLRPEALLEVRGLRVRKPDGTELVHGIDFDVRRGEIVGIVGESGSGKSLTAMSAALLVPETLDVDAECLRLGDIDLLGKVDEGALANQLALVYQDPGTSFNPATKLGSQLTEVPRRHQGRTRGQARAAIVRALETVRIQEPAQRLRQHAFELSGGMRQRAMIAAAIATHPALVIADEPTTALDVTVQRDILRELRRMNEHDGTAILVISHDLAVVRALCHRVLVMRRGEVVEELAAADLNEDGAKHEYTRLLIAATPRVVDAVASDLEIR